MCSDGHCSPIARHWEQGSIGRYLIKTTVQLTAQLAEVIRSSLGTKASALIESLCASRVSLFCHGPHNPTLVRTKILVQCERQNYKSKFFFFFFILAPSSAGGIFVLNP